MKIQHDVCLKAARFLWLPLLVGAAQLAQAVTPAQDPLFLAQPVRPLMMLNMSNDHQLFFKLYDDYSDLDDDGVADVGYMNDYDYYGYFDENKCYSYSNGIFSPDGAEDEDGYCNANGTSNQWSGNFLNWATMTRIDAVRKILYGGQRSTDTASSTVLERAFLPNDAHSFAKYYNGPNISRLTPFGSSDGVTEGNDTDEDSGITICNTTDGTGLSQAGNGDPVLRIARGNFSLWASNERWQCRWRDDVGGGDNGRNNNNSDITGIYSHSRSPDNTGDDSEALGDGDYDVRISVCEDGLEEENCSQYPDGNAKPTGVLQEYGEDGAILFGLMTGSYGKNKSGGVLRKQIGDLTNEINVNTDGTFKAAPATGNIIDTLDKLRIYGYSFSSGTYDSDNCSFGLTGFNDGTCKSWGNPQSEIFLESLRYLAGTETPTSGFLSDDSEHIPGMVEASWNDPVTSDNYCAPLNVIQFNASTSSYDGQAPGLSDIQLTGESALASWVDKIGAAEGINGTVRFIGETSTNQDELCTPKTVSSLSGVSGTCPDAPRLEGTYNIAGLAYYARNNELRTSPANTKKVKTYGVALASATPSVTIPVPSSGTVVGGDSKVINILPACQNQQEDGSGNSEGNCAIVDFKIIEQNESDGESSGKLYVNWEAAEQGGDYDSDMWGILEYKVTASTVTITTDVIQQSSSRPLGFGYVLTGTESDGFQAHSGINNFDWPENTPSDTTGCDNCASGDDSTTNTYVVGSSSATALEFPLYYAAKWGGYDDSIFPEEATAEQKVSAISDVDDPSTYFFATDPRELEKGLSDAFASVAAGVGSATSVATDSTSLEEGSYVYQARFNSASWTGEILAFAVDDSGEISDQPEFSTNDTMRTFSGSDSRNIFTLGNSGFTDFEWDNLTAVQQSLLIDGDGDDMGPKRLSWLRGSNNDESNSDGLRERTGEYAIALGDIVNSSPAYLGDRDRGYALLNQGDYATYLETKEAQPQTLFVGSNDGMLHAFDVENNMLQELFAYVPASVYPKLADLTRPNYGRQDNSHQYLVDGPVVVGDAYVDGEWASVVVGTLGAGGKAIYALDVTDRSNPELIFELSSDTHEELGYMLGTPQIVRMANGEWAVVIGNGYDSDDGDSQLVVIEFDGTNEVTTIDTNSGSGLSGVALLGNRYGQVQYAYAGDLAGNLWKFDLTSTDRDNWTVALGGDAMFQARDDANNVQPIYASPTLGRNAQKNNAVMVYFGTGKYFETADNNTPVAPRHSFYAIADIGTAHTGSRGDFLEEKVISNATTTEGVPTRKVSGQTADSVTWSDDHGWYMDFDLVNGERVITKPLLLFDKVLLSTITPSASPCEFGGRSWLMEVVAVGDRYTDQRLLENNLEYDSLIVGDPSVVLTEDGESRLITSTSKGELKDEDVNNPEGAMGRQSWRQLQ